MAYKDLLRDPRWQKKRLEIMERDGFACQLCGDEESTLNVHHGYYRRGAKPWEYPDETLHTLCEDCHDHEQERIATHHELLAQTHLHHRDRIAGYLWAHRRTRELIAERPKEDPDRYFIDLEVPHSVLHPALGIGYEPETEVERASALTMFMRGALDRLKPIKAFEWEIWVSDWKDKRRLKDRGKPMHRPGYTSVCIFRIEREESGNARGNFEKTEE